MEHKDPQVLKEAQALAGGLLWLATRTRPDISFGVATMSRLMSRNPEKALQVGHALLSYIKAVPGDLHYFRDIPNDGWGERHQLKLQRSQHSLEIFSDIAYAAGNGFRSIQGIADFFGGSPVGWQSSQQPFATHSTAESELVAYCESLLIGRAQRLCYVPCGGSRRSQTSSAVSSMVTTWRRLGWQMALPALLGEPGICESELRSSVKQ